MECRICYEEGGTFVKPCKCKGDTNVHEHCLQKWVHASNRTSCEICNTEYRLHEVFSWQFTKYCKGCFKVYMSRKDSYVMLSTFILSAIMFFFLTPSDFLLMVSIVSSSMYVFVSLLRLNRSIDDPLDRLLWWKISFTIPLWINLCSSYLQGIDECSNSCFLVMLECVSTCIFYEKMQTLNYILLKVFVFDIANLVGIFLFRSIFLCPRYHKKIVFDAYESEPLLSLT